MIPAIIHWSLANRTLVLLATALLTLWGLYAVRYTPLDALPDLSDVQVIIKTSYPGQAPQVVEDQVTYPLATAMLSVPRAKVVRGYSMFGDSFVYVLFEDGTDLYWARARVLEYLSQVLPRLPRGARPALGPDATGVGWIFEYALVDRSGRHDLAQLRALQDWFLKYELRTVPGVAEVATVGGMVKQYQVVVDPARLRAWRLTLDEVRMAIENANQETGGSVIELAEAEYMVRARGYLRSLEDLRAVPLGLGSGGEPIRLEQVADIRLGPEMRRGISELDGEGEVVGGIVVLRYGENALSTIEAVRAKLAELRLSLPEGVEIVTTYDRSALIERAVGTLLRTLIEEFAIVALVCVVFLLHLRASLVALVTLPLGILAAFVVMLYQGINANIMSLGGIAIAIGAMVDGAIVMIENASKRLEQARAAAGGVLSRAQHWQTVAQAAREVGPALFYSLAIITVSFLPVFTLQAQEGRLFSPLAFTKTYAMAAAAGLSVTLVPVLTGYFIRGRLRPETHNPVNRWLHRVHGPLLAAAMRRGGLALAVALVLLAATAWPVMRLGSEFMPPLDEGDILYMPTTLPGLSPGKAQQLLQQTDRILKTFPEVERVFGKAGRAETATDPAPLSMFETTVKLKPRSQWRAGMTTEKLIEEMRRALKVPGLPDVFVMPIRTRIDMLTTGIRTPVGIKVNGSDLEVIEEIGKRIEEVIQTIPGTASVFAERTTGARYVEVVVNRRAAARYGFNMAAVQDLIATAIGGMNITETIEGRERYPVNLRYPLDLRESLERLRRLPVVTASGLQIPLGELAEVRIADGPDMIRSENARLSGWISVDIAGRDIGSYVREARAAVAEQVKLPPGYSLSWSGQYEYLERAAARLKIVIPLTLIIIFLFLYFHFRNLAAPLVVMLSIPFALIGGFWLVYLLGYNLSVAVAIGFIALAGVAAEIGVLVLTFIDQALEKRRHEHPGPLAPEQIEEAVRAGTAERVRPIAMTASAIIAGLLPIMWGTGTGSEVMSRIAAPMIGGMLTTTLLCLLVLPLVYARVLQWRERRGVGSRD